MSTHNPAARTWLCLECGHPWPCAEARSDLARQYRGATAALGLLMATHFEHAARDLPAATAGDLWVRFLSWIRQIPAVDADTPLRPDPKGTS